MKKKFILLIGFITFCIGAGTYYTHQFPKTTFSSSMLSEAEKKLSTIEKEIWAELKSYGFEKDSIEKEARLRASSAHGTVHPLSKDTEKFVKSIINEVGLSDMNIQLTQTHDPEIALYRGNQMVINETIFNRYSPAAREFIIAHELGHAFYLDTFVKDLLSQRCGSDVIIAEKRPSHPICKFSRFIEWRADIWACKQGERFTKGYEEFWNEVHKTLKNDTPDTAKTHPKRADRCMLAQQLNNPSTSQTSNILTV